MALSQRLFFAFVLWILLTVSTAREHGRYSRHEKKDSPFVVKEPVEIARTDAGDIRVLPGPKEAGALAENNIGLSIITMEPKALLLPQYLDASCVFYVHKGQMTLGWVEQDRLNRQDMKTGDVYALPGGLVFYILNTDEGQRLRLHSMCDSSESLEPGHFKSFFVAGGDDPKTILSGFDEDVLAAAFMTPPEEVAEMLSSQAEGPFVYTTRSDYELLRANLNAADQSPRPFSLLKKSPDFKNENGWTIAVDEDEFSPLHDARVGVFAVSLKPGAMLAPHWNPRAAEVAFVTQGHGTIQVAFPNGTNALNEEVEEGMVFFVPRYFPMCQIGSRDGPFELIGFSTSSRPNRPQFLAGSNSVFSKLDKAILSRTFSISEKLLDIFDNQDDAVILPGFIEDTSGSSEFE